MEEEYINTLDAVNKNAFQIFKSYKSDSGTFIETGCHYGGSLTHAINAGYTKLYSCDIFKERVDHCVKVLTEKCDILNIHNANSIDTFKDILPKIDTDATFWLDAHDEGGGVPTFEELDLIRELFANKNSTIIIDDIPIYFSNSLNILKDRILQINPDYNFRLEYIHPNRSNYILVASTKSEKEMIELSIN